MKYRSAFVTALLFISSMAWAQTWTRLTNTPSFNASTALLLTDGTVMVQAIGTGQWWLLTPDNTGSYINGTWSQRASMQVGYGPLYYASAVLADGRLLVAGGEYNLETIGQRQDWTTKGAIYDPLSNSWTGVNAPASWTEIGDAQSVVLPDGRFMVADPFNTNASLFNVGTFTWSATGAGKQDRFDEEGWTLMPDGTVLTADALNAPNAEKYLISSGTWISAGSTVVSLEDPGSQELGPMVLLPNGQVFGTGANASAAAHTSIYTPAADPTQPGSWTPGPDFQNGDGVADGPAALLPNGNVLIDASPGVFHTPSRFYEYNGSSLVQVPAPPNAPNKSSFEGRMVVLPTGQVLFTDGTSDVEIYTPAGTFQNTWQPTISSVNTTLGSGSADNSIFGTQFNGLSQGGAYGDDAQSATNYPLVRITNSSTSHVFYAKTHNHSTMGVATGSTAVSTQFDIPVNIETGPSILEVVANGIPSTPVSVTIVPMVPATAQLADLTQGVANYTVGDNFSLTVTGQPNQTVTVVQTTNGVTGSSFDFGPTDGSGNLQLNGSWAPTDAAVYTQIWSVGGVPAPTLNFVVSPSVQLVDVTRGGTDYHAGDMFTLTVKGQPNQPVSVIQNTNNTIGNSPVVLGSTDGSGIFIISGTWSSSDVGTYAQVWSAGNLQARPVLSFTVNP
jgi:hypothetical protein